MEERLKEEIDAYISTRIESIKDLLHKDPRKVKEFLSLALSYESTSLLQNYYDTFSKIFNSATIPEKFKEKSLVKKGIEDLLEDIVALLNGPDGILGKNSKMFKNFEGRNTFLSEECKIYAREKIEEYIKKHSVSTLNHTSWVDKFAPLALDSKQKELYSHAREELKKNYHTPIELNLKQKRIYCDTREELKKNFSGEEISKFLNALKQDLSSVHSL